MTNLARLRQLHQQATEVGHELTPTATLDTLNMNGCPVCELLNAFPHLLDIAEAAQAIIPPSSEPVIDTHPQIQHVRHDDINRLREALNRLEQP